MRGWRRQQEGGEAPPAHLPPFKCRPTPLCISGNADDISQHLKQCCRRLAPQPPTRRQWQHCTWQPTAPAASGSDVANIERAAAHLAGTQAAHKREQSSQQPTRQQCIAGLHKCTICLQQITQPSTWRVLGRHVGHLAEGVARGQALHGFGHKFTDGWHIRIFCCQQRVMDGRAPAITSAATALKAQDCL